jgi:hypothetical protein
MKPRVSILSSDFKYTPAVQTDVRKTWAKHRRERAQEAERQRIADEAEAAAKVRTIRKVSP